MDFTSLDDQTTLKVMTASSPLDLRALARSNSKLWAIYSANKTLIWTTLIKRDFETLFQLLRLSPKWTDGVTLDGNLYLECLSSASAQLSAMAFVATDPLLPVANLMKAVILLQDIDPRLVRRIRSKIFLRTAAFTARYLPDRLKWFVALHPKKYYVCEDGLDYSFLILNDFVWSFSQEQHDRALPYIIELFVDGNGWNPAGYLSNLYCGHTKEILNRITRNL